MGHNDLYDFDVKNKTKKEVFIVATKLEYISRSLSKGTKKPFETYVINSIYNKLNDPNIEFVTQQHVATIVGPKYIDMYFPQTKIAVEIDEGYHDSSWQKDRDAKRMAAIKTAVLDSTITDDIHKITEVRIPIDDKQGRQLSVQDLQNEIDGAVKTIKEKTYKNGSPKWYFDEDDRIKAIISRGYLQRGDYLSSMVSILHVFGKDVKKWMKCTWGAKGGMIWSPSLSFGGSARNGWVNTINDDLTEIYESDRGGNGTRKKASDAKWDIDNKSKRYVFLKYKDALGSSYRRFIGVYMCSGYDNKTQSEIWKLTSDVLSLK